MKIVQLILNSDSPVLNIDVYEPAKMLAVVQMPEAETQSALSIWNFYEKRLIAEVEKGPSTGIFASCFSHSGRFLWYFINDRLCRYDINKDQKQEYEITDQFCRSIVSDREFLLVCGRTTRVVDLSNMSILWELQGYESGQRVSVDTSNAPHEWRLNPLEEYSTGQAMGVFHNKGTMVIICGNNQPTIQFYDLLSGKMKKEMGNAPYQAIAIDLGNNETRLAVSGVVPYANFVWDMVNEKPLYPELFNVSIGGSSSVCLHKKKDLMGTGSLVGYVSLMDLATGKFLFSKDIHKARVTQVKMTDGEHMISAGEDGQVFILSEIFSQ